MTFKSLLLSSLGRPTLNVQEKKLPTDRTSHSSTRLSDEALRRRWPFDKNCTQLIPPRWPRKTSTVSDFSSAKVRTKLSRLPVAIHSPAQCQSRQSKAPLCNRCLSTRRNWSGSALSSVWSNFPIYKRRGWCLGCAHLTRMWPAKEETASLLPSELKATADSCSRGVAAVFVTAALSRWRIEMSPFLPVQQVIRLVVWHAALIVEYNRISSPCNYSYVFLKFLPESYLTAVNLVFLDRSI